MDAVVTCDTVFKSDNLILESKLKFTDQTFHLPTCDKDDRSDVWYCTSNQNSKLNKDDHFNVWHCTYILTSNQNFNSQPCKPSTSQPGD